MSQIVGNRDVCERLCKSIIQGKLSHAFIIEGAKGTGKHTIALHVAAALACTEKSTSQAVPCSECRECKKVLSHLSPDVITVGTGDKSTMGVDTVRFLREDVRVVPNDLEHKIYIIEDADKMTVQAQNAFLLTLEEPPSFAVFILLCERADAFLETVRSRAPVFRTEPVKNEDIDKYICENDSRAAQMKLSSPKEYASLIMSARHGIGQALALLEPKAFASVKEMRSLITQLCDVATSQSGAKDTLVFLRKFSQKRDILARQLELLSLASRDMLMLKKNDKAQLEFFSDKEMAAMLCDRVSVSFLYNLSQAVITAIDRLSYNANVRITLTSMLVDAGLI